MTHKTDTIQATFKIEFILYHYENRVKYLNLVCFNLEIYHRNKKACLPVVNGERSSLGFRVCFVCNFG